MGLGVATAFQEITLVLFTSLAPSGVVAFAFCAFFLATGRDAGVGRQKVAQALWLPIAVVMVGLIASATHLGNPANALYVVSGLGRSPLSNEVVSGGVFLGLGGSLWLYSFTREPRRRLVRVWAVVAAVAGAAFLAMMSTAYDAPTVPTWSAPTVPLALVANGLVGGPLLTLLTLRVAMRGQEGEAAGAKAAAAPAGARLVAGTAVTTETPRPKASKAASEGRVPEHVVSACVRTSLVALAANLVLLVAYGTSVAGVQTSVASMAELMPVFVAASLGYVVLALAGAVVAARTQDKGIAWAVLACVLVFLGLFLTRFVFYMAHMTVGVAA